MFPSGLTTPSHPLRRIRRINPNQFYPDVLYLVPRGSPGRLPTDYEINLSLAYNVRVGPVTVTPQLYIFNLLNRQTETADDDGFNTNLGTFTNSGQPVLDNPDFRKVYSRTNPRLLRAALKIAF